MNNHVRQTVTSITSIHLQYFVSYLSSQNKRHLEECHTPCYYIVRLCDPNLLGGQRILENQSLVVVSPPNYQRKYPLNLEYFRALCEPVPKCLSIALPNFQRTMLLYSLYCLSGKVTVQHIHKLC